MKIAITGGGGFIGAATAAYARGQGDEVMSFDYADGNDILGDLTQLNLFRADVVIHLAGVLGTHELFDAAEQAVKVNVTGTLRILDWCREFGAGYVGITMPPVFPSVYTATKMCADRLASAWHREFGVPVSRVRAFNAYGRGQKFGPGHPQKIIPAMSVAAWRGEPVPVWGDGSQTVDLIHVDQLARVLYTATQHGKDETFDAGTGTAFTVTQVAELVIELAGSDGGIDFLPMRRGEIPTFIKAEGEGWDLLGAHKPYLAMDALVDTVRSYRAQAQG